MILRIVACGVVFAAIGIASVPWILENYEIEGRSARKWWADAFYVCKTEGGVKDIFPETGEILCKNGRTIRVEKP